MRTVKVFNTYELEREKVSWIEEYGSRHLQLLEKTGCYSDNEYIEERTKKDYPTGIYNKDEKVIYFQLNPHPSNEILEKTSELMDSHQNDYFHIYEGALMVDLHVSSNFTILSKPEDIKKLVPFISVFPHYSDQMVALLDWEHVV